MEQLDAVVLGSGAAGLTAAITVHACGARVGVFEKAESVGGTSAWSGCPASTASRRRFDRGKR